MPPHGCNKRICLRGAVDLKHQFFTALFFVCLFLYVCMLCTNFQDLCVSLLGDITLCILLLTAIATDDLHPLRSRSIHQNATNWKTIRFRYIAQQWGGTENVLHTLTKCFQPFTSRSKRHADYEDNGVSLEDFVAVETVLRHGRMFQSSDEV